VTTTDEWKQTACILCTSNCGIEVRLGGEDGRHFERIRGDKAHPKSLGYTCEKALRLDHYQNGRGRLTSPLRRRPDGSYEEIDWDTAIREVAAGLAAVKDEHGGETIFFYGGGGQGNHLHGAHGLVGLMPALGAKYYSNAIAQEKTGEFWVNQHLGTGPTSGDFAAAEVSVFVGKNPWQSHHIPEARRTLKAIAADPDRSLVIIDPRRTETADLADYFLQLRPGTDAWCLSALLGVIVQEDLVDHAFLRDHSHGADTLTAALRAVPVAQFAERCGVPLELIEATARRIATASSVAIMEDLGMEQGPHSTLGSYLEKLLWVLTGNFAKPGAMNAHSFLLEGTQGFRPGSMPEAVTPVLGEPIIFGLNPAATIADEILTDHPKRYRAMVVESSNPAHSLPGSARFREAMRALDFSVVIDVALTETGRCADYVLPGATQYEKWETTFWHFEFPHNVFHLRAPVLDPLPGTLPEAEIHARLVRELGVVDDALLEPLRAAAAKGLDHFGLMFFGTAMANPELVPLAAFLMYETLGPYMPDGAREAATLYPLLQFFAMAHPDAIRRAGFSGEGLELGNALFEAIVSSRSGVVFSSDDFDDTWSYTACPDRRLTIEIPELLEELGTLATEAPDPAFAEYPFVLSAGERRSSSANTIYRDPAWRKRDYDGALRISPSDAERLGLSDGGRARVVTARGEAEAVVEINPTMQPGHISLPNGQGLDTVDEDGRLVRTGVAPNELTQPERRDWLAGTPWHKNTPARVEAIA
jgi:anaerobic selenocysteine-containing dehydrogenase